MRVVGVLVEGMNPHSPVWSRGMRRMLPLREVHSEETNCVRRVPIFAGLTPEQQDLVASRARPMRLERGDVLHVAGARVGSMFVVHTGQIKLSRTMPNGRNRLLRVAQPGETVGEHAFLSGDTTAEEATALGDTQLCVFVHEDFAELVDDYPDIAMRMLRTLGDRLTRAETDLTLGTLSVDIRLADFLLQLPLRQGTTAQVTLPLDKKDIASLLGTTPESLSRALARLTADGLIRVDNDAVTLVDPQALEDRVAGG